MQVEGLGGWFAGAVSAVAAWAASGVASIATAAAEANFARAREMAAAVLARELGPGVVTGDFVEKRCGVENQDALVFLSFLAQGSRGSGMVCLKAAVVPGGRMELRLLTLEGQPLDLRAAAAAAAEVPRAWGASRGEGPGPGRGGGVVASADCVDVEGSSRT